MMVFRSKRVAVALVIGLLISLGPLSLAQESPDAQEAVIQAQIQAVYDNFLTSYRLGPGDVIGIHVERHPDDSVDRVAITPTGHIYHPLLGRVSVVGRTAPQIESVLAASLSEYIKGPAVTVSLLEANSAKIAVLGDVRAPGVLVMGRPMKVLDAIAAVGGITETGNSSKVSLLRQFEDGRVTVSEVNLKQILSGKASPEENIYLRPGDTLIVHGNLIKKIGKVSSVLGLGSFFTFLAYGKR